VALTVLAAAVASGRSRSSVPPGRLTVSFLDVGQGDATLIEAPAGAVLVDAGPAEARIASKLRAAGVRSLALAVLTHPQADHEDGFEDLLRRLPVRMLLDG